LLQADASEFLSIAKGMQATMAYKVDSLDEDLLKAMCYQARGSLAPMCAVIGGTAAQEVMKACTGKFMPVKQWLYFDSLESLPEAGRPTEADCAPVCEAIALRFAAVLW
jgi:ubiquitin-activating enzyme E1